MSFTFKLVYPISAKHGRPRVRDGDIVTADNDGVVVIPREKAVEVLKLAQEMDFKEHSMYACIEKLKSIEAPQISFWPQSR